MYGSGPCNSLKGSETVSVGPMNAIIQSFWETTSHSIESLSTAKFAAIVGIGPNFAYGNKDSTLLMSFGVRMFPVACRAKSRATPLEGLSARSLPLGGAVALRGPVKTENSPGRGGSPYR